MVKDSRACPAFGALIITRFALNGVPAMLPIKAGLSRELFEAGFSTDVCTALSFKSSVVQDAIETLY